MLAKEMRQLKDRELYVRLDEARRELFNLRQEWYLGRLEDNNRVTAVKRSIARIQTIIRERELAGLLEAEGGTQ
jgi:large subunit ribosomal protein L29